MLESLIVLHGDHEGEKVGRRIEALADRLQLRLAGKSIVILSSDDELAKNVARVLALSFGVSVSEHRELNSLEVGVMSKEQWQTVLRLVREKSVSAQVVIVATHVDVVDQLPTLWGRGFRFRIPEKFNTPAGTARVVHAKTGWHEHIVPA